MNSRRPSPPSRSAGAELPAWKPLQPPPLPEPPSGYVRPADYPTGQKVALLLLRSGELASACVQALLAMGAEASEADQTALREANLIFRKGHGASSRLMLTASGLSVVGEIMRDLAKKLDIHVVHYRTNSWGVVSGHCSCGHSWANGNKLHSEAGLGRYETEHLAQVKAGTYRPFDMGAFLAKHFPTEGTQS